MSVTSDQGSEFVGELIPDYDDEVSRPNGPALGGADQLFELTQLWWRVDHELAQVHDRRCDIDMTQPELPFRPPEDVDDLEF